MFYSMKKYRLVGFKKSNKRHKKYDALIEHKDTQRIIKISFGDNRYSNYHDLTRLNLYETHGDKKRRANYRKRAIVHVKKGFYSPSYFSYFYLW